MSTGGVFLKKCGSNCLSQLMANDGGKRRHSPQTRTLPSATPRRASLCIVEARCPSNWNAVEEKPWATCELPHIQSITWYVAHTQRWIASNPTAACLSLTVHLISRIRYLKERTIRMWNAKKLGGGRSLHAMISVNWARATWRRLTTLWVHGWKISCLVLTIHVKVVTY